MSSSQPGVLRAARTVANGEGDWAEVPAEVRDAIVMAITQNSPSPLHSIHRHASSSGSVGRTSKLNATPTGYGAGALTTAAPLQLSSHAAPSILTEGNVQSSIRTFEDAAWVRDEAVRSYAEFHNNIESLHASMRTQLHPVWKTAMQLRPGILAEVRDHFKLSKKSEIPEGVPITAAVAQHIAQQEMILDEVEDTLQMLRNTSVRFAAHFLSDEEKISMGANPAYLRAPDIDREVVESHAQSVEGAPTARRGSHSRALAGAAALDDGLVNSKTSRRASHRASDGVVSSPQQPNAPEGGGDDETGSRKHHTHARRRTSSGQASAGGIGDPLLEELRAQYQQRVRELEKEQRRASSVVHQAASTSSGRSSN